MTASATYHFLCCVDLTSKILLSTPVMFVDIFRGNTVSVFGKSWEKLFLEVLDNDNNNNNNNNYNDNNNNNNNNNNKDLFASSIFTMALRAMEKKLKTNKNVKIYQYITVNTKNMTTKIVKGLR